ncbi:MAG: hypothetical protein ACJA1L_000899 [Paracoccaceae bacterium]|jgi:hypothetical protein
MSSDDTPRPESDDTLSEIRRILNEEKAGDGSVAASEPATAPAATFAPEPARGRAAGSGSGFRAALVLTPTMRVNASDIDDDDALPPLRLTKRIDAPAARAEAAPVDPERARSVRSAFGREEDEATPPPLRLRPAARVDDAAEHATAIAAEPRTEPQTATQTATASPVDATFAPAPVAPAPVAQAAPVDPDAIGSMTRAALEELITERLRADLSGELGARISSNIRTLVQREVATAVAEALGRPAP